MAYDETLAARIRELVATERSLTEKRMFGGLAFLINGNMAVAASGQGGLLVRADPARSSELLTRPGAQPMVMRGREMEGWIRVAGSGLNGKRDLERWVEHGVGYAKSLPRKE